jgi:hypothetical protein
MPARVAALSVILVTDEGGRGLDRILDRLAAQGLARRIEVIVGAADPDAVAIYPRHTAAFHALRVIAADTVTSATARAEAIRDAGAPYVALAEDHCFPETDDWAERLVRGLDAGHAAVGPVMRNANPGTRISWANLLVEYGPWLSVRSGGAARHLPGHNSAYRRALLLAHGPALATMLEAEWVLHADLRARGHTLVLDPDITVAHLNYSLLGRSVRLQFLAGRMFAASRARGWSRARRLVFALLSPAIPFKRLLAVTRDALGAGEARGPLVASLPLAFLLLVASGIGEGLGYAFGDGGRRNALALMEYRRWRNLRPDEIHLAR